MTTFEMPANWFWIVGGDDSRYWSSATGAYVPALPGGAGCTRIASELELAEVLAAYGIPGPVVLPASVTAERERRISGGLVHDGVAYQLDADSQMKITAAGADARFAVLAGAPEGYLRWADPDTDFGWIATDNTVTPMDAQTMVAFSDTAKLWVTKHIFAARSLKNMDPIPADFADDKYWP